MIKILIKKIARLFLNLVAFLRFGRNISIGFNVKIFSMAILQSLYGGKIKVCSGCEIREYSVIQTWGGDILLGNNTFIGSHVVMAGNGGITIGQSVKIASHCRIFASNHNFENRDRLISDQGVRAKGVIIEKDVWLGAGVTVLDGVCVSKGTVVGAGSVVTKTTEPYAVYVGVPARKIRSRIADRSDSFGDISEQPFNKNVKIVN